MQTKFSLLFIAGITKLFNKSLESCCVNTY